MSFSLTLLVFAGAVSVAYVVLVTAYRALMERLALMGDDDAVAMSPVRRFASPEKLLLLRFAFSLSGIAAVTLFLVANDVTGVFSLLTLGGLAGAVGWNLPKIWYSIKVRKRRELFGGQVLGLTMILANGLRAGMALPQALAAAAERMAPPMQEELAVVLNENRMAVTLPDALERLYVRMPSEDFRLLVTSIRLTLQAGGSLSDILGRMVEMIRSRTEFQAKLKSMTAQGRFQAIAMSLAPLVVYILLRLIDPELMKPLTSTFVGWCAIGAVVVMLSIGFLIIKKIVTIEV